jgi:hypothetical protein
VLFVVSSGGYDGGRNSLLLTKFSSQLHQKGESKHNTSHGILYGAQWLGRQLSAEGVCPRFFNKLSASVQSVQDGKKCQSGEMQVH